MALAYGDNPLYKGMLDVGGIYQYRLRGEDHAWTPANVAHLQHAVRGQQARMITTEFAQVGERAEPSAC